jgi:8-oxo-dGTP diphosphatase
VTTVDDLWFLADEAERHAERVDYRLREAHDEYLDRERARRVSRRRFRTLAERIRETGAPYGAHTIVVSESRLLLVYDRYAEQWVVPGGLPDGEESLRTAARRELEEEAGVTDVDYRGLGVLTRVRLRADEYDTWGLLPVFAAEAGDVDPSVEDPDGEVVEAQFFDAGDLPADTRDRRDLVEWFERYG